MTKPICIYHGNCADGFTAAWAVRKLLVTVLESDSPETIAFVREMLIAMKPLALAMDTALRTQEPRND